MHTHQNLIGFYNRATTPEAFLEADAADKARTAEVEEARRVAYSAGRLFPDVTELTQGSRVDAARSQALLATLKRGGTHTRVTRHFEEFCAVGGLALVLTAVPLVWMGAGQDLVLTLGVGFDALDARLEYNPRRGEHLDYKLQLTYTPATLFDRQGLLPLLDDVFLKIKTLRGFVLEHGGGLPV